MKIKIAIIMILIGLIKSYGYSNSLPPTFDGPYQGQSISGNNQNH